MLYHTKTLDEVRRKLREVRKTALPDHLPRIFARCKRVTMPMIRRLGWCEPGIRAWWQRHGTGKLVEVMPVADLFNLLTKIPVKDEFTTRLHDLLVVNPAVRT
jgi:hypothetical protein